MNYALKEEAAMCDGDKVYFPEESDWLADVTRLVDA